ncbi:hypothetical protein LBMAG42_40420 [Deltaproteobacteria bacterium]|nr:hypothetical protein LBMAG42_40420 [Deltaproteobacteria bacterium]
MDEGASDAMEFYADSDLDGYGDVSVAMSACELPAGFVADNTDCDDAEPAIHPGATEDDCADPVDYNCDGSSMFADEDGDDWAACEDCDDGASDVNPGSTEVCDPADVDEDCSGTADDEDAGLDLSSAATWTRDGDADGFASDGGATTTACDAPAGYTATLGDCDDASAAVNPAASEVCDAADVDEDCDGLADDADASASGQSTWYSDADADTFGDVSRSVAACDAVAGTVADATDCDDLNGAIHPGAAEVCDAANTDENCNGLADDADPGADPATFGVWYADSDGDTYGDAASVASACDVPIGFVTDTTDCDDTDAAVSPAGTEVCDAANVDEDCSGAADDADPTATGQLSWYTDADADTFGDVSLATSACDAPGGTVADATDCDDADTAIFPGATEVCGGADEDCDALVDDADPSVTGGSTWYADADGDAFGALASTTTACLLPAGFVADASDCDDAEPGVHPGATEVCDAADVDEDCDGDADDADGDAPAGAARLYTDADGDGYGDPATADAPCDATGLVADATDCDDSDATVSPAGLEVCGNGADDDCDGEVDDDCPYSGGIVVDGSATEADYVVVGEASGDQFGAAVGSGVDLDGDGDDEWFAGAPSNNDPFTTTVNYNGKAQNFQEPTAAEAAADTLARGYSYGPTASGVTYAARMWGVNDIDGDGMDEYAQLYDATSDVVWLVDGSNSAGGSTYNGGTFHHSGFYIDNIASAGLMESTGGVNNFLLADTTYSSSKGRIYMYDSVSTSVGSGDGEDAGDYAGSGLAGGPGNDVDGDGLDDVFIGARGDDTGATNAGAVYTWLGGSFGGGMASADNKLRGGGSSAAFGRGLSTTGDTNGDGYADVSVGAPGVGIVYLFEDLDPSAATVDTQATDMEAYFYVSSGTFGLNAEGASMSFGDVDGDGTPDALLSSAYYDNGATTDVGATWLIYGPFTGSYTLSSSSAWDARFTGTSASDYCGYSSALGDLDADGRMDILIGCPAGESSSTTDYGIVAIFMGR